MQETWSNTPSLALYQLLRNYLARQLLDTILFFYQLVANFVNLHVGASTVGLSELFSLKQLPASAGNGLMRVESGRKTDQLKEAKPNP